MQDSPASQSEEARLTRRRRLLAVLAATLGAVGVLLLADALSTVDWKEPLRKLNEQVEQHRLAAELEARERRAQDGNRAIASSSPGSALSVDRVRREATRLRAETDVCDALGRLRIPRLDLDYVVGEGTRASTIRNGPGHYAATDLPGVGGTVGIAGHRGSYLGPFRHLERLRRGDVISVDMPYGRFSYAVTATRVVDPAAIGVLRDVADERLVLTTCHPPNSTKRLVVSAVRAGAVSQLEAQG